jgi:hypothetical protein
VTAPRCGRGSACRRAGARARPRAAAAPATGVAEPARGLPDGRPRRGSRTAAGVMADTRGMCAIWVRSGRITAWTSGLRGSTTRRASKP